MEKGPEENAERAVCLLMQWAAWIAGQLMCWRRFRVLCPAITHSAVSDSHLGYPAPPGSVELVEGRCSY